MDFSFIKTMVVFIQVSRVSTSIDSIQTQTYGCSNNKRFEFDITYCITAFLFNPELNN